MLRDEEGFTYNWKPNQPPTLQIGNLIVTCYPTHNVPVIMASSSQNYKHFHEEGVDDLTDEEMPDIVDSSSEEEWQTASRKKKNKNKKKKKSRLTRATPLRSAEQLIEEPPALVGARRSRP